MGRLHQTLWILIVTLESASMRQNAPSKNSFDRFRFHWTDKIGSVEGGFKVLGFRLYVLLRLLDDQICC